MITLEDYFGRMSHAEAPSDSIRANAAELLARVNALIEDCPLDKTPAITSGWRPQSYNATVPNAAPYSKHITGQAIDLSDPEGELDDFLLKNPKVLIRHKLWMEHPLATKGWCHLQSIPPKSGNLIFYP